MVHVLPTYYIFRFFLILLLTLFVSIHFLHRLSTSRIVVNLQVVETEGNINLTLYLTEFPIQPT